MIRDLIIFIYFTVIALIAYSMLEKGIFTAEIGMTMMATELFVIILLVIPEIFFRKSKLAEFLTKKLF